MEAVFFNIASEYGSIGVAVIVLFMFHRQAMSKVEQIAISNDKQNLILEDLTNKIIDLNASYEKHAMQLEYGDKEFQKIEAHQKEQDMKIHELKESVHYLRNKMLTKEHIELMIDAHKG